MASIRKRILPSGADRWLVSYRDGSGQRRFKQFKKKTDAERWMHRTVVDVSQGIHTASSQSVTVNEAGEVFIRSRELAGRQPVTIDDYCSLLKNHIYPELGGIRLSDLTSPGLIQVRDKMLGEKSTSLVRRIFKLLSMGIKVDGTMRERRMLEVGVNIPSREEVRLLINATEGRWRAFIITAAFTGMRCSELRGLAWCNVDFQAGKIRVRQRADKYNCLGPPKSRAGTRDLPMSPMVRNALREWKLQCPPGDLGLVFPTGTGRVEGLSNIYKQGIFPAQQQAGLITEDGSPKYRLHGLRHFFASWCINTKQDGGLGLPPKRVQYLLGHSTIQMTFDTYGHLFPAEDELGAFEDAEKALMACNTMQTHRA
jgi:integrase